jgi:hypothetical protein
LFLQIISSAWLLDEIAMLPLAFSEFLPFCSKNFFNTIIRTVSLFLWLFGLCFLVFPFLPLNETRLSRLIQLLRR